MAKKREGLSKRTRFEIFKRDGFKCLYCGSTPVEKALRVDHVIPVVAGGTNDPANLVTTCFDCNAGKGDVPLEKKKFVVGIATEADKERPEQIREWLALQRETEEAKSGVVDELVEVWRRDIGEPESDIPAKLRICLQRNPAHEVREAITVTASMRLYGTRQLKYFYGVLRRMRGETPQPVEPEPPPKSKWSARAQRVQRHLIAFNKTAGLTIDDIFREFAVVAWGSPDDIKYAEYTTEWDGGTECHCRGLVLRTAEIAGTTRLTWGVEDDLDTNPLFAFIDDLRNTMGGGVDFAVHRVRNPEQYAHMPIVTVEDLCHEVDILGEQLDEVRAFAVFLREGNETELRRVREKSGWPIPKWLVD